VVEVRAGDLLIVRFSPMRLEKLIEDAEDEAADCIAHGEPVVYSISTFGLVRPSSDVTVDDLIMTICAEAPVGGKNIWLTTARDLSAARFNVQRSEPPPHHYDVILGDKLDEADVQRLVDLLEPGRRRNPAWKR